MKRDMELVKQILLSTEESQDDSIVLTNIAGYSRKEISAHIQLMQEEGLLVANLEVDGSDAPSSGVTAYRIHRLTWRGYELLDSMRGTSSRDTR